MTAPLVALDPGVAHLGYAVLTYDEQVLVSGTWIPRTQLSGLDRHLWLLGKLQDLLREWQPGNLAYEQFTWQHWESEGNPTRGRAAMERLMGGIEALALWPPHPVLMPLLPQTWGAQLVGHKSHTKYDIAQAVNIRLHTNFKGDRYDNHQADAIGIALVALDIIQYQSYVHHHTVGSKYGI